MENAAVALALASGIEPVLERLCGKRQEHGLSFQEAENKIAHEFREHREHDAREIVLHTCIEWVRSPSELYVVFLLVCLVRISALPTHVERSMSADEPPGKRTAHALVSTRLYVAPQARVADVACSCRAHSVTPCPQSVHTCGLFNAIQEGLLLNELVVLFA